MDETPEGPGEIPEDEDLPDERPDDDGAVDHGVDDDELRYEEGFLAPGVPPTYEGSPGAALATESDEDIPEPNEPG